MEQMLKRISSLVLCLALLVSGWPVGAMAEEVNAEEATLSEATEETGATETQEPETTETAEPAAEETQEPAAEETQEPVAEETQEPVTEETQEPVAEETQEPVTEETQEPVAEETQEPVAEETQEPVAEETQEPVTEETQEPVAEETQEPVAEETAEPVVEETAEPWADMPEGWDDERPEDMTREEYWQLLQNPEFGMMPLSLDVDVDGKYSCSQFVDISIHVDTVYRGKPFTISWSEVPGAYCYQLTIDHGRTLRVDLTETSYAVQGIHENNIEGSDGYITDGDIHVIALDENNFVIGYGKTRYHMCEDPQEVIDSQLEIKTGEIVINWSAVEGASYYTVEGHITDREDEKDFRFSHTIKEGRELVINTQEVDIPIIGRVYYDIYARNSTGERLAYNRFGYECSGLLGYLYISKDVRSDGSVVIIGKMTNNYFDAVKKPKKWVMHCGDQSISLESGTGDLWNTVQYTVTKPGDYWLEVIKDGKEGNGETFDGMKAILTSGVIHVTAEELSNVQSPVDLSLSIGEVIEGRDITVSWNAIDGIDHYRYNVRDLTTDDLPFGETGLSTTKTSFVLPGKYAIANHQYRVWVGAYDADDTMLGQSTQNVTATPDDFFVALQVDAASVSCTDMIGATAVVSGGSGSYRYAWEVYCDGVKMASSSDCGDRCTYTATGAGQWKFVVRVTDAADDETFWAESASVKVEHDYIIKGCIKEDHEDGKGHALYDNCVCGAVKYTGYAPYKNCCECQGHVWQKAQEENNEWRSYCSNCGQYQIVSAPIFEQPENNDANDSLTADDHCTVHIWRDTYYDSNSRMSYHICKKCGLKEIVNEKRGNDYTAYLELQDNLGEGDGAYWKRIATTANTYLANGSGGLGKFIDAMSGGGGYLYNQATKFRDERISGLSERSQIKVQIWMDIILSIQNDDGKAEKVVDTISNTVDLASLFAEPALERAIENTEKLVSNEQSVVDDLTNAISKYTVEHDYSQTALNAAGQANLQLPAAQENLGIAQNKLNTLNGANKVSGAIPFVFAALKGGSRGSDAAKKIIEMEKSYNALVDDYSQNAYQLLCIIKDAQSVNNDELEYAAQSILNEITQKYYERVNETATALTKILDVAEKGTGVVVEFMDGAGESLYGGLTAMIPQVGLVQISSWIAGSTTNEDELAAQCELLSILRDMSNSLEGVNQYETHNGSDSKHYSSEIWAKLQQLGDDEASELVDILKEPHWYNLLASGSTLKQFAIYVDKETAKGLLLDEKELYQQYIESIKSE